MAGLAGVGPTPLCSTAALQVIHSDQLLSALFCRAGNMLQARAALQRALTLCGRCKGTQAAEYCELSKVTDLKVETGELCKVDLIK